MSFDPYILAKKITEKNYEENPKTLKIHGEKGKKVCQSDILNHLNYLQQSANLNSYDTYREYISWNKPLFKNLNVEQHRLKKVLVMMRSHINNKKMKEILSGIIDEYDTIPLDLPPIDVCEKEAKISESYLNYLLDGDKEAAFKIMQDLLEQGKPISEIYVDIPQQVQYRVGYLWHTNEITIAQEHYLTQATRLLMSILYNQRITTDKFKGKVLASCVPGELHDLGLHTVTDLLEMDGCEVIYLGSNTPTRSIIGTIEQKEPDVLALSVTIPTHVEETRCLIKKVKETSPKIKVINGGYSFLMDKNLWIQINSDRYPEKRSKAIELVKNLVS